MKFCVSSLFPMDNRFILSAKVGGLGGASWAVMGHFVGRFMA